MRSPRMIHFHSVKVAMRCDPWEGETPFEPQTTVNDNTFLSDRHRQLKTLLPWFDRCEWTGRQRA